MLEEDDEPESGYTPPCTECGSELPLVEPGYVVMPGTMMNCPDYGMPVFVLDPEVQIEVLVLPNGQRALVTDRRDVGDGGGTMYIDSDCFENLMGFQEDGQYIERPWRTDD